MKKFTFSHALRFFVFAAAAGSIAAWAGDAALISALEGRKTCTAIFENATWTPLLGETIPEKTGLEVGPETTVKLVHFGTNSEVTLPPMSRVTVLLSGIEGLASDTDQAKLEEMPQGLDLEARHQQQVGAVNMQHMAQMAPHRSRVSGAVPPAPAAAPAPVPPPPPPPSPVDDGAPVTEPEIAAPAPAAEREETLPTSESSHPMSDNFAASQLDKINKGGGGSNKGMQDWEDAERATEEYAKAQKGLNAAKSAFEAAQASEVKSQQSALMAVSIAIPLDRLSTAIGRFDSIEVSKAGEDARHPSSRKIHINDRLKNTITTWVFADITLPAGESEADVTLKGKATGTATITVVADDAAELSVSRAIRLEFRGLPAQAAAVWLKLLDQSAVSREIAAAHLRRLADAIAAKLR